METDQYQNSTYQIFPNQNVINLIQNEQTSSKITDKIEMSNGIKNVKNTPEVQTESQTEPQEKPLDITMAPDIDSGSQLSSHGNPSNRFKGSIISSQNNSTLPVFESNIFKSTKGKYEQLYWQKAKKLYLMPLTKEEKQAFRIRLTSHQVMSKPFENVGNKVIVKDVIKHGYRVFEIRLQMGTQIVQISVFDNIEQKYSYQHNAKSQIKLRHYLLDDESIEKFYKLNSDNPIEKNRKIIRSAFLKGLKEVALSKIMSALMTGPQFKKPLGFDIIRFQNGFCFNMEKCINHYTKQSVQGTQCSQIYKIFNQKDRLDLTKSLSIIHAFKITHNDIKGGNIMYSPNYGKFVFIDFDISAIVQEEINEATLINGFIGTPYSTGHEMKQILDNQRSKKNQLLAKCNLFVNDLQSLGLFFRNYLDTQRCFNEAVNKIKSTQHVDLQKELTKQFQNLNKQFENKLKRQDPPSKNLNLDKIKKKFSGYFESQMLWIRFYSHFYTGNMKQLKDDIMFFVDWQEWENGVLMPKGHIIAVLDQQMQKALLEVKNTFYFSDLSGQVLQFLRQMIKFQQTMNIFSGLDIGNIIKSMDYRIPELTDWMIFGLKKQMKSPALLEDYQSVEISLTNNLVTQNPLKIHPNYFKIEHQLLMLDQINKNQLSIIFTDSNPNQADQINQLKNLTVKEIVNKFVYYMSFRKRLGTTTLSKRKIIANFLLSKFKFLQGFNLQAQESKSILKEYFEHIRSYFSGFMVQYQDFQPILNSYLAIIVWLYWQGDSNQSGQQRIILIEYKIEKIHEILWNLALAGYYNEKMLIEITQEVNKWFNKIKELRNKELNLLETINLLLKFRQIKQISKVNCLVQYDIIRYRKQTKRTHQHNTTNQNQTHQLSFNRLQFNILKEAQSTYIQNKNSSEQTLRIIQSALEYRAIQFYLEFLEAQFNCQQQRYSLIFNKIKEMMVENPHQIIDMFKIVGLIQLGFSANVRSQTFQEILKQCQQYKNYHKEEPIPDHLMIKMFPKNQRQVIQEQFKHAYFQPEILVVLKFLDNVKKSSSAYSHYIFNKMNQIVWMEELCYQNCITGHMYNFYLQMNKSSSNESFLKFKTTIKMFAKQRNFLRERCDFFSCKAVKKVARLLSQMRADWRQKILKKSDYALLQILHALQRQFYESLSDIRQFAIKSLDVTSINLYENLYVILAIIDFLIMEIEQSQEEINGFILTNQKKLLMTEVEHSENLKQHLTKINRQIGLKITQYVEFITYHQSQGKDICELILKTLIMVEQKISVKIKKIEELDLQILQKEQKSMDEHVIELNNNCLKNRIYEQFYLYIIDTAVLLRLTLRSLYVQRIEFFKQNVFSNKQNKTPQDNSQNDRTSLLNSKRIKNQNYIIFLAEAFKSFKTRIIQNLEDPLNQIILQLYQNYKQKVSGLNILLKYINICTQACHIFIYQIKQIDKKDNKDTKSLMLMKEVAFRNIYELLIISFQLNSIRYGFNHEHKISHVCDSVFSYMDFNNILEFLDCFYNKWFDIKFETFTTHLQGEKIEKIKSKKAQSFNIYEVFSLNNRYLPLIISICNLILFKIFQEVIPSMGKDPNELLILELQHRNAMNKNMIFLRNICMKKEQNQCADLEEYIMFSQQLEDDGKKIDVIESTNSINKTSYESQVWCQQKLKQQIENNKLIFDPDLKRIVQTVTYQQNHYNQQKLSNNKDFLHYKRDDIIKEIIFTPERITSQTRKKLDKCLDMTRTRKNCQSAIFVMESYFQILCPCQQNGAKVTFFGDRVCKLFKKAASQLEKDIKIVKIIQFMNLYRVLTQDYSDFMKFINLSNKLNRIDLMVAVNRRSHKDYKNGNVFVEGLKNSKRKSNLYNLKKLNEIAQKNRQAMGKPVDNDLSKREKLAQLCHKWLVKKAQAYKGAYVVFLIRNLVVSN